MYRTYKHKPATIRNAWKETFCPHNRKVSELQKKGMYILKVLVKTVEKYKIQDHKRLSMRGIVNATVMWSREYFSKLAWLQCWTTPDCRDGLSCDSSFTQSYLLHFLPVVSNSLDSDSFLLGSDQSHILVNRLQCLVDADAVDFWEHTFIVIQTELL
ncbi:hypothetical protein STEG23_013677, partial [Scotinomys teguina]